MDTICFFNVKNSHLPKSLLVYSVIGFIAGGGGWLYFTFITIILIYLFLPVPPTQYQYPVRLVIHGNTTSPTLHQGTVQVLYNGTWGTVCDDFWGFSDAQVVCRMLGFTNTIRAYSQAYFGQILGPIHLDDVRCTGQESELGDCVHSSWGQHNCEHSEDAGVACTSECTVCVCVCVCVHVCACVCMCMCVCVFVCVCGSRDIISGGRLMVQHVIRVHINTTSGSTFGIYASHQTRGSARVSHQWRRESIMHRKHDTNYSIVCYSSSWSTVHGRISHRIWFDPLLLFLLEHSAW